MENINKLKIDIWGSCVSREIFNYGDNIAVGSYIFQIAPTTFSGGGSYFLADEKIVANSAFTRRMTQIALQNRAVDYFNDNFKSEYLMIDMRCCSHEIYVINGDTRVLRTDVVDRTFAALGDDKPQYTTISRFSITDEEWDNYIQAFISLMLSKYPQNRIILNEFGFSKYYLQDNRLVEFPNNNWSVKEYNLIEKINAKVKKFLPDCLILKPCDLYVSNPEHHLGRSPLHYVDEIYRLQNFKLQSLLGLTYKSDVN